MAGDGGRLLHDRYRYMTWQATAGGSFTYVALIEVLPRELQREHAPPGAAAQRAAAGASHARHAAKLGMLALGFGAMAVLANVV
jgi:hypothetical protein